MPADTFFNELPLVRDHVTSQLSAEGYEYIPREYDQEGEKKVTANGHLLGKRRYKCETFLLPKRGNKLFMLATECAEVLGYRDTNLLFSRNRSLYKISATGAEEEYLFDRGITRFVSLKEVFFTARSAFRQFGSSIIVNGRRVRDDYWETEARELGFTEEDLA